MNNWYTDENTIPAMPLRFITDLSTCIQPQKHEKTIYQNQEFKRFDFHTDKGVNIVIEV